MHSPTPSLNTPHVEQGTPQTPQALGTELTESTAAPADLLSPHKLTLGQAPEPLLLLQMLPLDQFPAQIPVLSLSTAPVQIRQLPPHLPTTELDCPNLLPN